MNDTQHDSSEEIREASDRVYEKEHFEMMKEPDIEREYAFEIFEQGYKSATAKAQAEIERLEQSAITMAVVYQDTLDKLKKQYKTEEHKCCGHCKRESDGERREVE